MILLDTNALLWAIGSPGKLGPSAIEAVTTSTAVHYSPISIPEMRIKHLLGRLSLPDALLEQIHAAGFRALPFSEEDADAIQGFPGLKRHDPFDRMILGQAAARSMDLYTSNRTLLSLGLSYVHDCRR